MDRKTIVKALEGVQLYLNPELWDESLPNHQHNQAVRLVYDNLPDFRRVVQDEIKHLPLIQKYFGHLILERLLQDNPLSSAVIQKLFTGGIADLENRLSRIDHVPNVEQISVNSHAPKDSTRGDETDEIIRDIWTEFFIADFLTNALSVKYLEKVIRGKSKPAVEFYVQQQDEEWIIEVARLRKKDFWGQTMPWGSKDCTKPENVDVITNALRNKLHDKNRQIQNFIEEEGRGYDRKIVAIKTSQEEYQDCQDVIIQTAKKLLEEHSYPYISHLLLVYDIESFDFVVNLSAVPK